MILPMKIKKHNWKWHIFQIIHSYRITIVGDSRSRKPNESLNLIKGQPDIDNIYIYIYIYIYAKGPYEAKYQYLINKYVHLNHYDDPKSFYGMLKWYARCS